MSTNVYQYSECKTDIERRKRHNSIFYDPDDAEYKKHCTGKLHNVLFHRWKIENKKLVTIIDYLVNKAIFKCLFGIHKIISITILTYFFNRLAGVLR